MLYQIGLFLSSISAAIAVVYTGLKTDGHGYEAYGRKFGFRMTDDKEQLGRGIRWLEKSL